MNWSNDPEQIVRMRFSSSSLPLNKGKPIKKVKR